MSWVHLIPFGNVFAGMGDILWFVESVVSENGDNLPSLAGNLPSYETVEQELLAHGKAFDQGLLPCQQLLEVVVVPFFQLGRKVVELQSTIWQGVLDAFARGWGRITVAIISGEKTEDSQGKVRSFPVLRLLKRAELVKELVKSKLVEVRFRVMKFESSLTPS